MVHALILYFNSLTYYMIVYPGEEQRAWCTVLSFLRGVSLKRLYRIFLLFSILNFFYLIIHCHHTYIYHYLVVTRWIWFALHSYFVICYNIASYLYFTNTIFYLFLLVFNIAMVLLFNVMLASFWIMHDFALQHPVRGFQLHVGTIFGQRMNILWCVRTTLLQHVGSVAFMVAQNSRSSKWTGPEKREPRLNFFSGSGPRKLTLRRRRHTTEKGKARKIRDLMRFLCQIYTTTMHNLCDL